MNRRALAIVVMLAGLGMSPVISRAEDVNEIFKKVNEYIAKKNFPKALEELNWAKKEIEKQNQDALRSFLPDQLAGFTGEKFEANDAFGISNIERSYRKDSTTVKVSLTGGSGSGAGAFGGLAALGSMAAMMGAQQGTGHDTFRISGRTATLDLEEGSSNGSLTVFLESGSILKLEMDSGATRDSLKSVAEALKLNDLDNYLKGVSAAG